MKSAPQSVPQSALETASPSVAGERWKTSRSDCVTPDITAVSNPNSSPARLATTVMPR